MKKKIVINIPEELIEAIKCSANNWSCSNPVLDKAIKEGIVLPEGCGDLIDRDALNLDYEVSMADDWKTAHEIANCVKYADAVIPVDKETAND